MEESNMRVCKSQCSMFKELYRAFINGEVEEETRSWMLRHREECSYCREWAKSFEENREDIIACDNSNSGNFDDAKEDVKRAKTAMYVGLGMIIFLAMWMSIRFSA